METEIKKKNCKECGNEFTPFKTTDRACSMNCEKKIRTKKSKPKPEDKKKRHSAKLAAVIAFGRYIRTRDKDKPCVCCGKPLGINFQCGHYFSGGGHSSVMFDEMNAHAQRYECNNYLAGNITDGYTEGIISRIGEDEFTLLRERAYTEKKYTIEEYCRIAQHYNNQQKKQNHDI